jgi:hypothetical protein
MLYVYDYGIQFYGGDINCTIPYEHILSFGSSKTKEIIASNFMIEVFAKIINEDIENGNNGLKFFYSNNKTYIKFYTDNPKKLKYLIEKNMKYHIIHNKLNFDVLDYYIYKQS